MLDEATTRVVRVPDQVLVQRLPDGESVILDMKTEQYFGLNEVGASMWDALTKSPTVGDAATRLMAEYDVEPSQLMSDLADLVNRLVEHNLLELADS